MSGTNKTAELVADAWTRERARYIVSVSGHGNTPARLYCDEAVNREPVHVGTIDDCDRIVDLGCARAVLAALAEAGLLGDEWLPIDSAPLNGAYVDVWDGTSRRTNCSYQNGGWVQYTGKDRGVTRWVSGFTPTHWRHRPGPPGAGDHT